MRRFLCNATNHRAIECLVIDLHVTDPRNTHRARSNKGIDIRMRSG
jgi:hypothetical protein